MKSTKRNETFRKKYFLKKWNEIYKNLIIKKNERWIPMKATFINFIINEK